MQTSLPVPFLGKLWNTPCLEYIQNTVSDIGGGRDQIACSTDQESTISRVSKLFSLSHTTVQSTEMSSRVNLGMSKFQPSGLMHSLLSLQV